MLKAKEQILLHRSLFETIQVERLWSFYIWFKKSFAVFSIVIIVWVGIKYTLFDTEFITVITTSNYNSF